jgi:hypothetical protein
MRLSHPTPCLCLQEWLLGVGCNLSGLQEFNAPTPRAWLLLEEDGRRTLVSTAHLPVPVTAAHCISIPAAVLMASPSVYCASCLE